jgi:hypothetical protein
VEASRASEERAAGRRRSGAPRRLASPSSVTPYGWAVSSAGRFDSSSLWAAEGALSEDGLWHVLAFAAALPLHEDRGAVVGEPSVLVADERLAQPAQGLGRRLTDGGFTLDEPAEILGAEPLAVLVSASVTPSV